MFLTIFMCACVSVSMCVCVCAMCGYVCECVCRGGFGLQSWAFPSLLTDGPANEAPSATCLLSSLGPCFLPPVLLALRLLPPPSLLPDIWPPLAGVWGRWGEERAGRQGRPGLRPLWQGQEMGGALGVVLPVCV
jgi:hypothetical protein